MTVECKPLHQSSKGNPDVNQNYSISLPDFLFEDSGILTDVAESSNIVL